MEVERLDEWSRGGEGNGGAVVRLKRLAWWCLAPASSDAGQGPDFCTCHRIFFSLLRSRNGTEPFDQLSNLDFAPG
jgi:hypothetical protein